MSLFGGGGGGGGGSQPDTTTQYIREAPGIEERKIGLMDTAAELARTPVNIPTIQTQGLGALEQQGITQSGVTGVGANTLNAGIGSVLGAQGAAALDPTSTLMIASAISISMFLAATKASVSISKTSISSSASLTGLYSSYITSL